METGAELVAGEPEWFIEKEKKQNKTIILGPQRPGISYNLAFHQLCDVAQVTTMLWTLEKASTVSSVILQ